MASQQEFSFNLGLAASPEATGVKPAEFAEFVRMYNAIKALAFYLDRYTGALSYPEEDWSQVSLITSLRPQFLTRLYPVFAENMVAGEMVHLLGVGNTVQARKADASDATRPARAFCYLGANAGDRGEVMIGPGAITNLAGLTAGAKYYLSVTAGLISTLPPVAPGELIQEVGFALSDTVLWFQPTLVEDVV